MMKIANLFFLLYVTIILVGCSKNGDENIKSNGKAVFYTDVQSVANCGPFNVDIFVDNDSVGSLPEPYVETTQPNCISSSTTLMLEKPIGQYHYSAQSDCGDIKWNGNFEIYADSCSKIFLDLSNATDHNIKGQAVFYTNAQTLFNCGASYFVEVYVDNASLGFIWQPYVEDTSPDCVGSVTTLFLERKIGTHSYIAKTSCGNIEWRGNFEIYPGSCTTIFLDITGKF